MASKEKKPKQASKTKPTKKDEKDLKQKPKRNKFRDDLILDVVVQQPPPQTEDELFDWNQVNASLSQVLYPEEESVEDQNPDKILLEESISKIRSTSNKLGYALTDLHCINKGLGNINGFMEKYVHLRTLNLSKNKLKDINSVEDLKYLVSLDASNNLIEDVLFLSVEGALPQCLEMNFSHNKIENLCDLCPKRLRKLNLSHNPLKFLEGFSGHKQLQILELRATNLKQTLEPSTKLPNLTHLYLSAIEAFEITNLVLPALPSLETLHLRGTPVETLDLKDSPNLKYLNMRETKVSKIEFLNNLIKKCTKLEVVIMSGTPMEEEGEVGDLKKALQIKTIELSPLSPENGGIQIQGGQKKLIYSLKRVNKDWVGGIAEGGEPGEEADPQEILQARIDEWSSVEEELKERRREEEERRREEEERQKELAAEQQEKEASNPGDDDAKDEDD